MVEKSNVINGGLALVALSLPLLVWSGTPLGTGAQSTQPPSANKTPGQPQAAGSKTGEYVGEDTCLTCHTDQQTYKGSPHGMKANERTPAANRGCESCHGPGKAHAERKRGGLLAAIRHVATSLRRERRLHPGRLGHGTHRLRP